MSFSDLLQKISDSVNRFFSRVAFVVRAYPVTIVLVAIVLTGSLIWWASAGFSLQLSRFFANEVQTIPDTTDGGGAGGGGAPSGGTSTGGTTPSTTTTTTTSGSCEPVKAADQWMPPGTATTNAAGQKVAANGLPYCTPPPGANTAFPTCFVVDYTDYKKEYTNFADLNGIGDPLNLVTKYGTKVDVVGYRGLAKNTCPWTVHYSFRSIGSKKAGTSPSGSDLNQATEIAFTRSLPGGSQDIKSCWNTGTNTCDAPGLGLPGEVPHEILYKISTYTCGRVYAGAGWDHFISGGGPGPLGNNGFNVVFNYGRDCSGSAAEKAPGSVTTKSGSTSSGSGGTASGACKVVPQPAALSVQCGATQNVLTWTNPASTCVLSVLRSVDGGTNTFLTSTLPLSTTTYTDANIQPGHSYTYAIKNHPSVTSNTVTCTNGAQTGGGPAQIASSSPIPTSSALPGSAAPTPDGTTPASTVPPSFSVTPVPTYSPGTSVGTGAAGGVSTGPGEATVLALLVSAIVSLAYVSYTHSNTGVEHEVNEISKDQGPLDFRS